MGAYLPGSSVAPADVAGLIYNLYVGLDPRAKAVRAEVREWKEWNRALHLAVKGKCPHRQPHFMGTDRCLEDLVGGFCDGDYADWCQHWIYFSLRPRGAPHRLSGVRQRDEGECLRHWLASSLTTRIATASWTSSSPASQRWDRERTRPSFIAPTGATPSDSQTTWQPIRRNAAGSATRSPA